MCIHFWFLREVKTKTKNMRLQLYEVRKAWCKACLALYGELLLSSGSAIPSPPSKPRPIESLLGSVTSWNLALNSRERNCSEYDLNKWFHWRFLKILEEKTTIFVCMRPNKAQEKNRGLKHGGFSLLKMAAEALWRPSCPRQRLPNEPWLCGMVPQVGTRSLWSEVACDHRPAWEKMNWRIKKKSSHGSQ